MSTLFGHLLLIFSIVIAFLIFFTTFVKNQKQNKNFYVRTISILNIIITIALLVMLYLHIASDFSIMNVLKNSHSLQPMLYKITGFWGNHEGSMLLWLWILSLYTYTLILLKNIPYIFLKKILRVLLVVNMFFITYVLVTSNPFLQIKYLVLDGTELNPILQDIVLTIHPPLIYCGYIGLTIPMALTVSYLQNTDKYFKIWLYYIRIYNTISWVFLTCGILLGSWWAYYELGWGGWWFWDPVENVSLMPWILSTAALHHLSTIHKKEDFQKWTYILVVASFYTTILSTFFVRSGLIDSVHSFTADSNRGLFIFLFSFFFFIYYVCVFYKYAYLTIYPSTKPFSITSNRGYVLLNQIFLSSFYILVILGTFYPTIHFYIFHTSITVGPSYYNQMLATIIIPLTLLTSFSIDSKTKLYNKYYLLYMLAAIIISVTGIIYVYTKSYNGPFFLYFMIPILSHFFMKITFLCIHNRKIISKTVFIAHTAFILFISSVVLWFCFRKEHHLVLYPGDNFIFDKYTYVFKGINIIKGPNYDAFYGLYSILKSNTLVANLFPEKRHYIVQNFYSSKVDIHSNLLEDLHVIVGDGNLYSGWATTFYNYPFMSCIWICGAFLCIGGLHAINNYTKKNNQVITWK